MYQVDYARFHQTVPVSDGVVSRESAQQQAAARADNSGDDTSTTTDDDRRDQRMSRLLYRLTTRFNTPSRIGRL